MDRRNPTFKPSFYKILIDFAFDLGVPKEFAETYRELLPEKARLRIASGATWEVAVEKWEDDRHYFTRGWTNFSRDMGLQKLELLVFDYVGDDTFLVTVYGTDAFEKKSNFQIDSDDDNDSSSSAHESSNPRFEILLSNYQLYRMNVGKDFAAAAGLIGGERVRLEFAGGKSGEVLVHAKFRKSKNSWNFAFTSGWADFRKANGLGLGNTYSFKIVPFRAEHDVKVILVKLASV
ncbi:hypothetical protein C2S52_016406 [Perilla frutescens var. hirtella]|nr:hypothetical protein C2S52_016406 [Perilla frutescens var. hirtella]